MNPVTFCGRTFSVQEVELMRVIAQDYAGLGVTEIARTVSQSALGTSASGVRGQRMRTAGVGVGGRRSGEPTVA